MLWKLILKMSQVFQILADIFGPNTPKGLWSGIQEKKCATNLHYCLDIVTTKSDFQLVLSCFVKAPCAVFLSTKGVVFLHSNKFICIYPLGLYKYLYKYLPT